jgi:WD40 repeat protein
MYHLFHYPKLVPATIATVVLLPTALLTIPPEAARALAEDKPSSGKDFLGDNLPPGALARCGTTRLRNQAPITSVAYGCEGKVLVSGARGAVRLFDAGTGTPAEPTEIKSADGAAACSPDGKWLATESPEGGLRLHDLLKGAAYDVNAGVDYIAPVFSGDNKLVACAPGHSTTIFVVDMKSHSITARLKMSVAVAALALSPDGKFLAAGGGDPFKKSEANDIRIWDTVEGKIVTRLGGHDAKVMSLSFVLGGKVLASAGLDGTIRLWDVAKWEQRGQINTKDYVMTASPDGKVLATTSRDDMVHFWDADTGKKVGELVTGGQNISALVFSPDGKRLAVGANSCTVTQWDIATGKEVLPLPGHREPVRTLAFSPVGKMLASRGNGRTIRFWDPATGKEQRQITLGDWRWHNTTTDCAYGLAFTPDWTKLAVIGPKAPVKGYDPTFQVLDVKTGDTLYTFTEEHQPGALALPPAALAVSPDGQVLASVFRGVRLFSLRSGEELPSLRWQIPLPVEGPPGTKPPPQPVGLCAAFSPDGRTLAVGLQTPDKVDNLQLWDWTTGRKIRSLPGHKQERVASGTLAMNFSPGGHILATCGRSGGGNPAMNFDIRLWEVASGTLTRALKGHEGGIAFVALSPDGRMLASAGYGDKTVRVWDVFTGKEIAKFAGHSGPVNTVAWSPDGKMLASGSSDTTVLVWDTSRLKVEPPATEGKPEQLAKLWDDLRQRESAKAFDALWSLAGAGDKAAELFDKQLKPAAAPDPAKLKKLLTDLGDDKPEVRDAAGEGLAKFGPLAEPALREKRKEEKLDPEVSKRIDELLDKLGKREATDDELRDGRAVLALELIGTARCRDVLRKLAEGADGAPLTRDAKAALKRLAKAVH